MFSSSEKLALNWLANRRALARDGNTEQANLYKTSYAYSWLTYGRQVIRTEQTFSGSWNNDGYYAPPWA